MHKYLHVIAIGWQNTLVYRVNFLFRSVFSLIPLMATIYLWRAVYASKDTPGGVAGYTLAAMTSYYLVITLVDMLTAVTEDDWQIAADIREGQINHFLLKPMNYMVYRLCLFFSGRIIYTLVAFGPVAIFIFFQREYFVFPTEVVTWGFFGLSLVLTALLQFFMSFTMALLAFWVLEVSTFIFIMFALEYVAGGHLFPLDILPAWIERLLYLTPFPYLLFFPVSIYLERVETPAIWQGLMVQAGWLAVSVLAARAVWSRGIQRYSAYGG